MQRGEQAPLEEQEAAARVFLDCWGGIGDAFAAAEPEELRAILRHSVEVIEFRSVNPGSRQGEYAIRMFPEVDASFGQDLRPRRSAGATGRRPNRLGCAAKKARSTVEGAAAPAAC